MYASKMIAPANALVATTAPIVGIGFDTWQWAVSVLASLVGSALALLFFFNRKRAAPDVYGADAGPDTKEAKPPNDARSSARGRRFPHPRIGPAQCPNGTHNGLGVKQGDCAGDAK